MRSEGDAAEAFLRERPRPVVLGVPLSPGDVPGPGGGQLPLEGHAVVHVVMRWRSDWAVPRLDSIHATAESAREREAVLEPDYSVVVDTVEVYTSGADVAPWEEDGPA